LSGWKAGRWSYDGESLPGDGARGGGGPPRKRGAVGATDRDGAADRVRQRSGRRGRGSGRHSAERRTQDADGAGGDTSSAMGASSRVALPGVRANAFPRSASRGALGEGRGDEPRQSDPAVLDASHAGARGRIQDREGLSGPVVLPAA